MTRKRFVKLLMAFGYSRNSANYIATIERHKGCSYSEAYDYIAKIHVSSGNESLAGLFAKITKIVNAFCEGLKAFNEAFIDAMEGKNEVQNR